MSHGEPELRMPKPTEDAPEGAKDRLLWSQDRRVMELEGVVYDLTTFMWEQSKRITALEERVRALEVETTA